MHHTKRYIIFHRLKIEIYRGDVDETAIDTRRKLALVEIAPEYKGLTTK